VDSNGGTAGRLDVWCLGTFRVAVDGRAIDRGAWTSRKAKHLVKLLALQPAHQLHREQILEILWPNLGLASADNQLHKAVHGARRALEPGLVRGADSRFIVSPGRLVRLEAPGTLWIDADEFERLASAVLRENDVEAGETARALYRDDLLPEDLYEEWTASRREHLRMVRRQALVLLAEAYRVGGKPIPSMERLHEVLTFEPADESAHRSLIALYAATGRRNLALRQYRACREALRAHVDAEPDADTLRLVASIRAGGVAETPLPVGTGRPDGAPPAAEQGCALTIAPPPAAAMTEERSPEAWRDACTRPRVRLAALAVVILALTLWGQRSPWLYRSVQAVGRLASAAGGVTDGPPRLVSIAGRGLARGARVETLDSAAGWAVYATADGEFDVPGIRWSPGATYELLVGTPRHGSRLVSVVAPAEFPVNGVVAAGDLVLDETQEVDVDALRGVNSVAYESVGADDEAYCRGVFDAITVGSDTDADRIDAVNSFVASRFIPGRRTTTADPVRFLMEGGSGMSGYFSLAMARLAFAGGYEVRLVDVFDAAPDHLSHRAVEVRYAGAWHLYDPAYGISFRRTDGAVASYADLSLEARTLETVPFQQVDRLGWASERMRSIYASGIHRYTHLTGRRSAHGRAIS
jgi:DNA-binding SARP family transcriptional activator